MSGKQKPIPIRDFIFEGLTDRSLFKSSGYFPRNKTKQVFQMPRTLPKNKKGVKSQRHLRISETFQENEKKLVSHLSSSKMAPALVFHTINSYLMLKRQERPSFEPISPSYRCLPKTPNNNNTEVRQRPKTSIVRMTKVQSEEFIVPKRQVFEKKLEKISVYIKSPDIDLSDYSDF